MDRIPRESTVDAKTRGHPLPPPVASEQFCPYPTSEWERYWQYAFISSEGVHPKQEPCCVCGRWKPEYSMQPISKSSVSPDVLRKSVWSQLESLFLCRGCAATCCACGNNVPRLQVSYFDNCLVCIEAQKRDYMQRTGSKKAPALKRKKSSYELETEAKAKVQLEARKKAAKAKPAKVLAPSSSQAPNQLKKLWAQNPKK